jgi:hypothetical protein
VPGERAALKAGSSFERPVGDESSRLRPLLREGRQDSVW